MCKTEESSMTPLLFSTVLHGAFTLATSGTKRSLYRTSSSRALSPQMRSCRGLAGGKTTPILQEVVQHVPSGSRAGPWSPQSLGDRPGPPPTPCSLRTRASPQERPRAGRDLGAATGSLLHAVGAGRAQARAGGRVPWPPQSRPAAAHAAHMGGGPAPEPRGRRDAGEPGQRRRGPPRPPAPVLLHRGLLTARTPWLSLPARVEDRVCALPGTRQLRIRGRGGRLDGSSARPPGTESPSRGRKNRQSTFATS